MLLIGALNRELSHPCRRTVGSSKLVVVRTSKCELRNPTTIVLHLAAVYDTTIFSIFPTKTFAIHWGKCREKQESQSTWSCSDLVLKNKVESCRTVRKTPSWGCKTLTLVFFFVVKCHILIKIQWWKGCRILFPIFRVKFFLFSVVFFFKLSS